MAKQTQMMKFYIDADKNFSLVAMSKKKDDLKFIYGELVGISKVSQNRYKMMCELLKIKTILK